jgi:hypothetical protein
MNQGVRHIFYIPVENYNGLVVIASLDAYFMPGRGWPRALASDLLEASPIILICALIMGWIISKIAASPIKQIAEATEEISERDLILG